MALAAGRHPGSFSFTTSSLSLPGAGGSTTTIDRFIMVAHDATIEKTYIDFVQVSNPLNRDGPGTLTFSLFQSLADGATRTLYPGTSVDGLPTDPLDLGPSSGTLQVGRSLFLRIVATPGGSTPWWDTGTLDFINGTCHLLSGS